MTINLEMPRYVSHKRVWALKIKSIAEGTSNEEFAVLTFEEDGYAPLPVDVGWYFQHKPVAGGYYVVYQDGYKSFSPAKAFEDGYTLQDN